MSDPPKVDLQFLGLWPEELSGRVVSKPAHTPNVFGREAWAPCLRTSTRDAPDRFLGFAGNLQILDFAQDSDTRIPTGQMFKSNTGGWIGHPVVSKYWSNLVYLLSHSEASIHKLIALTQVNRKISIQSIVTPAIICSQVRPLDVLRDTTLLHVTKVPRDLTYLLGFDKIQKFVNFQDSHGNSPMHCIAKGVADGCISVRNAITMLNQFRNHGSNPTIRNVDTHIPATCLLLSKKSTWRNDMLRPVTDQCHVDACSLLFMLTQGIDTAVQTWLHLRVCQQINIYDALLSIGLSLQTIDSSGNVLLANIDDPDFMTAVFTKHPLSFTDQLQNPALMDAVYKKENNALSRFLIMNDATISHTLIDQAFEDCRFAFLNLITDRIDHMRLVQVIIAHVSACPETIRSKIPYSPIIRVLEQHEDKVLEHGGWCNSVWFEKDHLKREQISELGELYVGNHDHTCNVSCSRCRTTRKLPFCRYIRCRCGNVLCSDCVLENVKFDTHIQKIMFSCPGCTNEPIIFPPVEHYSTNGGAEVLMSCYVFSKHYTKSRCITINKHKDCDCCKARVTFRFSPCERGCYHCRGSSITVEPFATVPAGQKHTPNNQHI